MNRRSIGRGGQTLEVVQRANKAWNAHDAAAIAAAYAEGAIYSNPRAGKNLTGEAIRNAFPFMLQ